MLGFKSYMMLTEGGNVKIGGHTADEIHVTPDTRPHIQKDVHEFLHHLGKSFHHEHGSHLFGKDDKALHTGSAYSGSTKNLMDKKISHDEFVKHKKSTGDLDVKVPKEHMENLHKHLETGKKFGKYTVLGVKKGAEHHALIQHENGQKHQIDFEPAHYEKDEPSKFDQFSHSADWHDTKAGIKGVHHKQLLNAVGTDRHKFSILHGHASRTEKEPHWEKDTKKITKTLFGHKAEEKHLHSFHGLVHNIKTHIPASEHQKIYDKFKKDVASNKNINNEPALNHMRKNLDVKA